MELELKHLAAYLPYELNVILNKNKLHYSFDNEKAKMIGIGFNIILDFKNLKNYINASMTWFKPILRPLKNLHNDFVHNIPIEVYNKNPEKFSGKFVSYLDFIWQNTNISEKIDYYELLEEFSKDILEIANYHVLEILLKNHFDIFGLIDAGLAVNINYL